ncbi:MAG: leucine-rich repeat protein [Clostridia bacterium]|nr:leucine-rich repeat protein [Clostridia bacterium]
MGIGKKIGIVISCLAVLLAGVLLYMFYPAILGVINGSRYYSAVELQHSYDKGYDDGNSTKLEINEKLDYYISVVDDYENSIKVLNTEITKLNESNKAKENEIGELTTLKYTNLETISNLNATISDNSATIESLNNQINGLNTEIENLNNDLISKQETINLKNSEINDLNTQVEGLNAQMGELTSFCESQNLEIANLNAQIESLDIQISNLTISGENKDSEIANLVAQKNTLNNQISELTAIISGKNSEITDLQSQIEVLEGTIASKNTEIEVLNAEIVELETANADLSAEIVELNNTIKNLTGENAEHLTTIGSLREQIGALNNRINTLTSELTSAQNQIQELNNRIVDLQQTIEDYEEYIATLEASANLVVAIFEFDNKVYAIEGVGDNHLVYVDNPISTDNVVFNYWMVNGERVDLAVYEVTTTTKFVANVTYKYNVTFEVDGEVYATQLIEKNTCVQSIQEPVKEKYTFNGWSIDGYNVVDVFNLPITTNITFKAIFTSTYGLFNTDTGANIYTWDELIDYEYLALDGTTLSAGENYLRLSGDLYIDEDVTMIADNTFYNCSGLVNVYLPDNVESIGKQAFYECLSLRNIELSNNLKTIENSAFYGCKSLISFIMPDSVEYTGSSVLRNCTTLTNLKLSNSLKELKDYSFYQCKSLSNVTIPDSLRIIRDWCFGYCNIISIDLNKVEISTRAFYENINIESITIPSGIIEYSDYIDGLPKLKMNEYDGVNYLGNETYPYLVMTEIKDKDRTSVNFAPNVRVLLRTFSQVKGITEVTLPNTIVNIGYEAFYKASVTSLVFPENVKILSERAICWGAMQTIVMNEGLEYIGDGSLEWNHIRGDIVIPSTVKYIGYDAFSSNSYITSIDFGANSQIEYIGYWAFDSLVYLRSIFLPKSLKDLNSIFVYGTNLSSIRPPFYDCHKDLVIYVEAEEIPEGWTEQWNYRSETEGLEYKLGYTYEQYLEEISAMGEE